MFRKVFLVMCRKVLRLGVLFGTMAVHVDRTECVLYFDIYLTLIGEGASSEYFLVFVYTTTTQYLYNSKVIIIF